MKYYKIQQSYLLIIISFTVLLPDLVIFGQKKSSESQKITDIKEKVESNELSTLEVMQKLKESGLTPEQILNAKEKLKNDNDIQEAEDGIILDAELDFNQEESELIKESEQISHKKEESIIPIIKHFGYDFFKGTPNTFQIQQVGPVDLNYKIGPGDELVINMWGETELRYIHTVSREGTIYIDNIGQIIVNGLTVEKLEQKLLKTLSKAYVSLMPSEGSPSTYLDVTLGKIKPITVYFTGEIQRLGAYKIDSYSTVFNALYYVGGPKLAGSLRNIQVIRNNEVISHFDLYDYLLSGTKVGDIRLQNEDNIYIPPRGKTITLKGEVLTQGIFELKEDETLRDLISFAGGLLTEADIKRLQIERVLPFEERSNTANNRTVLDFEFARLMNEKLVIEEINLADLDIITIYPILDQQGNFVTITGAVFRPGKYALIQDMDFEQLIIKAQGYLPHVYYEKADLIRQNSDGTGEYINLNPTSLQTDKLLLQNWDKIHIYSKSDLVSSGSVEISGMIPKPGIFPYKENLKILDLIFMSGGLEDSLRRSSIYSKVTLTRYILDAKKDIQMHLDLDKILLGDEKNNIILQPNDFINIFYDPDFIERASVSISGEINFPGSYFIGKDMTLSQLFHLAGGFKDNAFIPAISFEREDTQIRIDYEKLISSNRYDFPLLKDDIILVPKKTGTVSIDGSVNSPGVVKFISNWNVNDYIESSGGLHFNADSKKIYIQHPGGVIKKYTTFNRNVPEGSTIIVYEKEKEKDKFDLTEFLTDITQILASLATIMFILQSGAGI